MKKGWYVQIENEVYEEYDNLCFHSYVQTNDF